MFHGLRIVDFHTHFPYGMPGGSKAERRGAHVIKQYAEELRAQWRREWDFCDPEPGPHDPHELAQRWSKEIERYGLEYVVFVTGGGNSALASYLAPHQPKMIGFAHHNIEEEGAADELKRAVDELGFKGLKLLAPLMNTPFEAPQMAPVWEFCAERTLPVLIHFGVLGGGGGLSHHPLMNPLTLHEVARRYPEIPFVIPHFGAGYWQELLHLAWACPNVYVDSSGSNQWVKWMPYELTIESLFKKAFETMGPKRIIFGTDSSWFPRGFAYRYLQDQVRACMYCGMNEEQLQNVFADNAKRLLKLN